MAAVNIDGVAMPHSLSAQDVKAARKSIEQARIGTNSVMHKLRESIAGGDATVQKEVLAGLSTNQHVLLTCAIAANKSLKKRRTLESCLEAASSLSFAEPLAEPVPVYPKPKSGGGVRMIHDHGLHHRTAQALVQLCVSPFFKPRSFQYTFRGVPAAITKIKELLSQGYVYVGRFDVKRFYDSFDPEQLSSELPLPIGMAEYAVVGRHMKVELKDKSRWDHKVLSYDIPSHQDLLCAARRGIPHGSTCSPVVSSYCMSHLPWPSVPEVVLINYADDFLLMALSMARLQDAAPVLVDAVGDLPGGHFELKWKEMTEANDAFSFLGHQLWLQNGDAKVSPTPENINSFWKTVADLDQRVSEFLYPLNLSKEDAFLPAVRALARLAAYVTGWRKAFAACDDLDGMLVAVQEGIAEYLKELGISSSQLKASIDPSMIWPETRYLYPA